MKKDEEEVGMNVAKWGRWQRTQAISAHEVN